MGHFILSINFGSTSTKFAVYNDEEKVFVETINHPNEELVGFSDILSQREYREKSIRNGLAQHNFDITSLEAVVGRGGLTHPIPGGTYTIDTKMIDALSDPKAARHASSLSGIVAYDIAKSLSLPCFTVDAVVTDELDEVARFSGFCGIERVSIFHALNQKAMARRCATELGKKYEDCNFIVAHMGGGVSVGAHKRGRVIDVNNGLEGDGPFSPERAGGLPVCSVIDMCYSGKYSKKEISDLFIKKGGILSYLGTNDGRVAEDMAQGGDPKAQMVLSAMAHQVSKEIGAMAAVLGGEVDAIVVTGGMAYCKPITQIIEKNTAFIAKNYVYGGENEMLALTQGALRVLNGEEKPKSF